MCRKLQMMVIWLRLRMPSFLKGTHRRFLYLSATLSSIKSRDLIKKNERMSTDFTLFYILTL